MTDPRVEAAARELCIQDGHNPDGDDSYIQSGMGANWRAFKDNARTALAVADEAAWRHVSITPRSTEWVNIVSKQGGEVNYAVAQWDYSKYCWWNPELELMYSPAYFTHWVPLPAPPNAEASPAPETITIP
ncbi:hypothetical protein [Acetobacter lambici]|uniref:DUF551 domain-containing protein n=1 Tax=Acetobacter lambici TaxID=1332824 RepID=A0ABT1EZI4_9PROT|nr:hypothetical protein [Acetobacter lambici]MCP1242640.1 hypothetical protein [Acetobacter lambici]MCP1258352.1 hypothetical protein [Acetobacter lambici]